MPGRRRAAAGRGPWIAGTGRSRQGDGHAQRHAALGRPATARRHARALACDVDILFADEPTGNLDEETAQGIIDTFRELAHDQGKCVVVVTHSQQLATQSDRILDLRRGKLTEQGNAR